MAKNDKHVIELDSDPHMRGVQIAALANAIKERIHSLTRELSAIVPENMNSQVSMEIRALLTLFPSCGKL